MILCTYRQKIISQKPIFSLSDEKKLSHEYHKTNFPYLYHFLPCQHNVLTYKTNKKNTQTSFGPMENPVALNVCGNFPLATTQWVGLTETDSNK